jgi:hypothetical protein
VAQLKSREEMRLPPATTLPKTGKQQLNQAQGTQATASPPTCFPV